MAASELAPADRIMASMNAALIMLFPSLRKLLEEIVESGSAPASQFERHPEILQTLVSEGHLVEQDGLLTLGPSVRHSIDDGEHRFEVRFGKSWMTMEYPTG
jgi:hypothetical protein